MLSGPGADLAQMVDGVRISAQPVSGGWTPATESNVHKKPERHQHGPRVHKQLVC